MSVIATALKHMLAAGMPTDAIVAAVAAMEEELCASLPEPEDTRSKGAIRTARYRENKRHKASQSVTCVTKSDDVTQNVTLPPPLSPNEINSNPHTPTPGDNIPRARKADPFPKPEWADPQHWADFLANRKLKRCPNTATAYFKLLKDIEKFSDDEWPPGKIMEHAAARGWAGIYDPRTTPNGRPTPQSPVSSLRGQRPDPALDMWRQANAELAAEAAASSDTPPDFGTWLALPPQQSG